METDLDFDSSTIWPQDTLSWGLLLPWHGLRRGGGIPVEILSEIFLFAVEGDPWAIEDLMLVCRHWYAIMLSTPGLAFPLRVRKSTQKEAVQAFIQGRRSRLNVIVNIDDEADGKDFNADDFHASFMAAAEVASRWRSLCLVSFPPSGEYGALQIVQPLKHLESFEIAGGCNLGNFFGPLMIAITTTTTQYFTEMDLRSPDAILYLLQPACLHIFHSLTTLCIWPPGRMQSLADIDILPYLQRLEELSACYLNLPIYPSDVSLPLLQTLQSLRLKSISVQWMAGRVFPVLHTCSIVFPRHADSIQASPPVVLPSCTTLEYDSNDVGPLRHFSHPQLAKLQVKSGQWSVRRGNMQLAVVQLTVAASSQTLQYLQLCIQCSEHLLMEILKLVPALDRLKLGLASPHALSEAFFQRYMAIQPSLSDLSLFYKRWLRGAERTTLIPIFGDIKASCDKLRDFTLNFDEGAQKTSWSVRRPVKKFSGKFYNGHYRFGFSGPHGITLLYPYPYTFEDFKYLPFKEVEYLHIGNAKLSVDILLNFHQLIGLSTSEDSEFMEPAKPPPHNFPLCNTLRVLDAHIFHHSYWAGQPFHKLDKCVVHKHQEHHDITHCDLLTEMPVCTRLDVSSLTLLATFRLPQIRELGVPLDHPKSNSIWSNHIALNANLSGLKLFHVKAWHPELDLIQVLVSLPLLESLVIRGPNSGLNAPFFRAFVPMDLNNTSGLKELGAESQVAMPWPMLKSVWIEDANPRDCPVLMTVLKDVVTQRAVGGSPLKRLTFWKFDTWRLELIGEDGEFSMEQVPWAMDDGQFELDIQVKQY